MKYLLLSLLALSCAHETRNPASSDASAHASMAFGNVQTTASKLADASGSCFEVQLSMVGTKKEQAQASNWEFTGFDKAGQAYTFKPSDRTPASTPVGGDTVASYGSYSQWSNRFTICANEAQGHDIKQLQLTPKSLPYSFEKPLTLSWQ